VRAIDRVKRQPERRPPGAHDRVRA
jgi:hypothetical protein